MISEANSSDKTNVVTEEQFAQMLSKATNLWLKYHYECSYIQNIDLRRAVLLTLFKKLWRNSSYILYMLKKKTHNIFALFMIPI